jgi:uncharacterized protein (TIGR03083 family)
MTLTRDFVVPGMVREYSDFADLIRGLSAEDWQAPSRCEGWKVADVAAHVVGTLTDVSNLKLDGLGTPEVTNRQVDERRGRTPGELAEELDGAAKRTGDLIAGFDAAAWTQPGPQPNGRSLGHGVETLWYDTFVHADDIRAAIGEPSVSGSGATASVSHLADALSDREWGPATIRLDGLDEFSVNGGGGRVVTGDALAFILAATGRLDPAPLGLDGTVNVYR